MNNPSELLLTVNSVANNALGKLGLYPCKRFDMTERESKIADMVETLCGTLEYIESISSQIPTNTSSFDDGSAKVPYYPGE